MNRSPYSSDTDIAVWVVEDDARTRQNLAYLLDHVQGLQCAGAFCAYEEVQRLVEDKASQEMPDVVLMDIGLPGVSGLEGIVHLKAHLPRISIVMLTIQDRPDVIFEALRAGASGYLLKDTPLDQVVAAVREAHHGGMLMPAPVASKVLQFFTQAPPRQDYGLTPRETEVLQLMGDGLAYKQIADALSIAYDTVSNHIRHIYRKLHVHSSTEAVSKAYQEGLLSRQPPRR